MSQSSTTSSIPAVVDNDAAILKELRQTCPVAEVMPASSTCRATPTSSRSVPTRRRSRRRRSARWRTTPEPPDQLQLGESNPPVHTQIRKLLGVSAATVPDPRDGVRASTRPAAISSKRWR